MWSILKLSIRHSRKILHVSELLLSSFFLTHNLKQYFTKPKITVLKRFSSEELLLLMENKIVNILDHRSKLVTNGVVLNDMVYVSLVGHDSHDYQYLKDTKLHCRYIQTPLSGPSMTLELIDFIEEDGIAVYKIQNPPSITPLEVKYQDLKEGEKLLVYSPRSANDFVLQDTYILRKNILELAYKLPVHKTTIENNDSGYSDIAFDYYGNFQGYIAPSSQYLIDARAIQYLHDRVKAGQKLEKVGLGVSLSVRVSHDGCKEVFVNEVETGSLAGKAGLKAGDVVREVNGIRVRTIEDIGKIIGYAFDNEVEFSVLRDHQPIVIKARV